MRAVLLRADHRPAADPVCSCHCEERRDEAIPVVQAHEPSVRFPAGDCFVASLLAMTWGGLHD